MSIQDILAERPRLSVEDREQIAKALRDLEAEVHTDQATEQKQRTPNLHPGAWEMAPDFDKPMSSEGICLAGLHEGMWSIMDDFDEPLM